MELKCQSVSNILAVALLFGLIMGKFAQRLKVPKVTGYILAGLIIGPSFLGLLTKPMVNNLKVISEVTLGLIILSIGADFELKHFISISSRVAREYHNQACR
ncbi:MAG: cation:proton antiporter [Candidatus Margulisbacteria bacterium]|nr:cation:proton antiporter [Candidatus Margulisiibacteriota bacterium]MBU1617489.1 cation:proton antiporter [Candidatus Margulisiibacteriota bacterium]